MDYKIPKRLKALRLSKGLTQQELGNMIGLRSNSIARFETGNGKPSLDTLVRIALLFQVSVDYLIGITNEPESILSSNDSSKEQDSCNEEIAAKLEEIDKLLSEIKNQIRH